MRDSHPLHLLPPNRPQCANVYVGRICGLWHEVFVEAYAVLRSYVHASWNTLPKRCDPFFSLHGVLIVRLRFTGKHWRRQRECIAAAQSYTRISPGPGIRGISKGIRSCRHSCLQHHPSREHSRRKAHAEIQDWHSTKTGN